MFINDDKNNAFVHIRTDRRLEEDIMTNRLINSGVKHIFAKVSLKKCNLVICYEC